MINEINSLTPGSILTFNILSGELEQKQYYFPVLDFSFQSDKLAEIESLLSASVKAHMVSDVPLGVFLSGGIDSSLITHYASKISSVTNFTISTDSEYDESKYAMIASKATSSELDIKKITGQDFIEEYEYWGFVNDDPVSDPSALALMILSRHVNKKGYKVMLAGEGADELFGGYNSYLKFVLNRRFSNLPVLGKTLNKILSNRFQKLKDYGDKTAYLGTAHLTSFAEKRQLFREDVSINSAEFEINYLDVKTKDNLRLACLADQNYRLPADILARTDRATMAYSIEARVPFLSPEIINFSNSLSEDQCLKIRNSRGKVLLKELCLKYFKKDFVYRKKVGFELPVSDWLSVDFKDIIHKNIQKQKFDFINYSYIRKVYENDSNPGLIWAWLQLENWYDKIFELNASTKHPKIQNDEDLILYFENTKLIN
jgi:asparagine synthase (glutamine-hydrolysing)